MSATATVSPISSPAARDAARAGLLRAFLASGLVFMLVPGTLLGVLNLLQISGRESVTLVSPGWIQAHGHAQIFGWVGSFMIGIGVYSVPAPAGRRSRALGIGWTAWTLWTAGVALRWIANVDGWHWRLLLPWSAALELAAFLLFFYLVSGHRADSSPSASRGSSAWIAAVMVGTAGWIAALALNLMTTVSLAEQGASPAVPHLSDQHLLTLLAWGVLAPFIWGFSARWMPVLLGLAPPRPAALLTGLAASVAAVVVTFAGRDGIAAALALAAAVSAIVGLRLFERPVADARVRGVDARFPLFVRLAYIWLIVATGLGAAAVRWDVAGGLWGASRHAFTVGFTAAMVLAVGQRMLPGFAAHRTLWSPRLMGVGLSLLMLGCLLRVSTEALAYDHHTAWAWSVLPISGVFELTAVGAFAVNLYWTMWG